jgi:hypothetical protein
LGTIVVLLWANYRKKYWKDIVIRKSSKRNVELKAWQLGAKAHELFMLASLSFMVFYHMRRLLIGRTGIPFGLLTAPFTTTSPGMFFNKSFQAGFSRNRSFGLLLVIVCVLSVVLGPSSAIVMIPSLGWFEFKETEVGEVSWPKDGERVWYFESNNDDFDLWPTTLNSSTRLNETEAAECAKISFELSLSCPSAGFLNIVEWVSLRFSDSCVVH